MNEGEGQTPAVSARAYSELETLPGTFRPPTLGEEALFESYKEAMKQALAAANAASDKVLTAAFTLATAYGALLGLVKPKDTAVPLLGVVPFIALGAAAVIAASALLVGLRIGPTPSSLPRTVEGFLTDLTGTISAKQRRSGWAVVAMAVAMIISGIVVFVLYAPAATPA